MKRESGASGKVTGEAWVGIDAHKEVWHNTFASLNGTAVQVQEACGWPACQLAQVELDVRNNVWMSNQVALAVTVADSTLPAVFNVGHNAWFMNVTRFSGMAMPGAGDVVMDPLLTTVDDLPTPQAGSPLQGAGQPIAEVTTDYLGNARSNPPTIGAVELPH